MLPERCFLGDGGSVCPGVELCELPVTSSEVTEGRQDDDLLGIDAPGEWLD